MTLVLALAADAGARNAALATGTSPDIPWLRILFAFLFCCLLAFAAIAFIRMRAGMPVTPGWLGERLLGTDQHRPAAKDRLEITQRLGVTPGSQIVVLRHGSRNYVLHLTQQGATEIDRFEDEDENKGEDKDEDQSGDAQ